MYSFVYSDFRTRYSGSHNILFLRASPTGPVVCILASGSDAGSSDSGSSGLKNSSYVCIHSFKLRTRSFHKIDQRSNSHISIVLMELNETNNHDSIFISQTLNLRRRGKSSTACWSGSFISFHLYEGDCLALSIPGSNPNSDGDEPIWLRLHLYPNEKRWIF